MSSRMLVVVLFLGAAGCGSGSDASRSGSTVLIVSGDTAGWIVPCGCASNQSGGLPRRGSYVGDRGRQANVVYVDAGGASSGTSEYERLKFEAILDGEMAMGLAVHNIGRAEAALGAAYLRQVAREKSVPLLSANLRDSEGRPIAEPMRIVEAAGKRIAFVGVLSPRYAVDGLKIEEPRKAVLAQVAAAAGGYDSLVVLAYLPEDELLQLAEELPEADVVVGGPTGQSIAPKKIGPTLLAAATNKGKFLIDLELATRSEPRWTGRVVEMGGHLADDPVQVRNLERFRGELARRDLVPEQTRLVAALPEGTPSDYRLAGTDSCARCHEEDCAAWSKSKHAQAWASLDMSGSHVDPYCQQCHTDGYGLPGGFVSAGRTPDRINVGCETCHGPSQAHVDEPELKTPFAAKDQCVRCHDQENSPKYDAEGYWDIIQHGPPWTKTNEPRPGMDAPQEQPAAGSMPAPRKSVEQGARAPVVEAGS